MSAPKKHHYIPKFYLKRWCDNSDRVTEFSRPWKNLAKAKKVHPSGTGYLENIYSFLYSDEARKQQVEKRYFKSIDDKASIALAYFNGKNPKEDLDPKSVADFLTFAHSLEVRCPEDIHWLRNNWTKQIYVLPENRSEFSSSFFDAPSSLEVEDAAGVEHSMYVSLRTVSMAISESLLSMRWRLYSTENCKFEFLTSDRPIIRTYSLSRPDSLYMLPIGPRQLFFGYREKMPPETLTFSRVINRTLEVDGNALVRFINQRVVENAVKYVYGTSDRQQRLVQNRMSARHYLRLVDSFPANFLPEYRGYLKLPRNIRPNQIIGMPMSDWINSEVRQVRGLLK